MKNLPLILTLLISFSSCMQLLPEGRELARLRMEHEKQLSHHDNKKLVLILKQAEVEALQKKLRIARKSVSDKRASSVPTASANDELNRLRKELTQKQAELRRLEQEVSLSN